MSFRPFLAIGESNLSWQFNARKKQRNKKIPRNENNNFPIWQHGSNKFLQKGLLAKLPQNSSQPLTNGKEVWELRSCWCDRRLWYHSTDKNLSGKDERTEKRPAGPTIENSARLPVPGRSSSGWRQKTLSRSPFKVSCPTERNLNLKRIGKLGGISFTDHGWPTLNPSGLGHLSPPIGALETSPSTRNFFRYWNEWRHIIFLLSLSCGWADVFKASFTLTISEFNGRISTV